MHPSSILPLLLASASAAVHGQSQSRDRPGADPAYLNKPGAWHWTPSPSSSIPGLKSDSASSCKQIQYPFPPGTNRKGSTNYKRAEAVKKFYADSFNKYAKDAFGKDFYDPITGTGSNGLGGWGAIIIDGIDTAVTMGLTDIVNKQLDWIAKQDFTHSTDPTVDGFDTTIRLIAGLLSAYDLITSGKVPHAASYDKDKVKALLTGATDLANFISPIFNSPTGLPYYQVNSTTRAPSGGINTAIAGTIILEYYRLSDLTGNETYRKQADKSQSYLVNPKPAPVYPGLVGSGIDNLNGQFTTKDAGWHGEIDSFLEYLIKAYIYNPKQEYVNAYLAFWEAAVNSTIAHIAVHPYGYEHVTWLTSLNNSGSPLWAMDDYATFAAGNFLLGGKYLGNKQIFQLGLDYVDSIYRLFNTTKAGLNPFAIAWFGPHGLAGETEYNGRSGVATQARHYYKSVNQGYFIDFYEDDGAYSNGMFPEPLESIFYAWRITGNKKYQDYNWKIFESLSYDEKRNGNFVGTLNNVTQARGGTPAGDNPSFFWAEMLKYLYLTFSDPELVSLDDFQFNTECHPFRIQGGTCSTP